MRPQCYLVALAIGATFLTDAGADCFPGGGGQYRLPHLVEPANAAMIKIEVSDTAKEPCLIVPKQLASRAIKPSTPHAAIFQLPSYALVGLGLTLSLGTVTAGFYLTNCRRSTALAVVALALFGTGSGLVFANAPPPSSTIHMVLKAYPRGLPLDNVAVEFVDKGDTIRLILPRRAVADLAEKLNATEARP